MRYLPTHATFEEAFAILTDRERYTPFQRELLSSQPDLVRFFGISEPRPKKVIIPHALDNVRDILLDRITTDDIIFDDQGLAPNNIPIVLGMILAVTLELEKHGEKLPVVSQSHLDAFLEEIKKSGRLAADEDAKTETAILSKGKKRWNADRLQYYTKEHGAFLKDLYDLVWAVARAGGANKTNGPQTLYTVLRLLELAGA